MSRNARNNKSGKKEKMSASWQIIANEPAERRREAGEAEAL